MNMDVNRVCQLIPGPVTQAASAPRGIRLPSGRVPSRSPAIRPNRQMERYRAGSAPMPCTRIQASALAAMMARVAAGKRTWGFSSRRGNMGQRFSKVRPPPGATTGSEPCNSCKGTTICRQWDDLKIFQRITGYGQRQYAVGVDEGDGGRPAYQGSRSQNPPGDRSRPETGGSPGGHPPGPFPGSGKKGRAGLKPATYSPRGGVDLGAMEA